MHRGLILPVSKCISKADKCNSLNITVDSSLTLMLETKQWTTSVICFMDGWVYQWCNKLQQTHSVRDSTDVLQTSALFAELNNSLGITDVFRVNPGWLGTFGLPLSRGFFLSCLPPGCSELCWLLWDRSMAWSKVLLDQLLRDHSWPLAWGRKSSRIGDSSSAFSTPSITSEVLVNAVEPWQPVLGTGSSTYGLRPALTNQLRLYKVV